MTIDFLFGWADVAEWALIVAVVSGVAGFCQRPFSAGEGRWTAAFATSGILSLVCAIIDVLVNHLRWVP